MKSKKLVPFKIDFSKLPRLLLAGLFCTSMIAGQAEAQTVKKATQGTGAYKDKIWWLDFESLELAAGQTVNQTYSLYGGMITLQVTIDNISFNGALDGNTALSNQRLIGYNSGAFGGDGLVMLYNTGVTNNGATVPDRMNNTLFNAVSMKYNGNYTGSPNEARANLRVRAYAFVTATGVALDAGLVFADAETNEPDPTWPYEEYSQGTTNGSPWQLLEKALHDPNGYQSVQISNSGLTAKTVCGFNGFTFNAPGNVAIMYTHKAASSVSNPLSVNLELKGGGNSATAIGLLIAGIDKSDAPSSYSMPSHIALTEVNGGNLINNTTYYISSTGTYGGSPVLPANAQPGFVQNPILGTAIDFDDYTSITGINAKQDDNTGIADEDGVLTFPTITSTGSIASYTVSANVTNTGLIAATLYGWVDWNGNGVFDTGERQSTVVAAGYTGAVSLTWTNITVGGTSGAPGTYARFRISTDVQAASPVANAANGEAEDYFIPFSTPLPVTLHSFYAREDNNKVQLNWTTTAEQNCKGFALERSADALTWNNIGFVESKAEEGNSSFRSDYSFIDTEPIIGRNFYRLKQIELDGKSVYSDVRLVSIAGAGNSVTIQPNPFRDNINMEGLTGGEIVEIFDVNGRMIKRVKNGTATTLRISLNGYNTGLYYFSISTANKTPVTGKILKIE